MATPTLSRMWLDMDLFYRLSQVMGDLYNISSNLGDRRIVKKTYNIHNVNNYRLNKNIHSIRTSQGLDKHSVKISTLENDLQ